MVYRVLRANSRHASVDNPPTTLTRLDHPSLPKVSDTLHEGGREYLVMDFVEGRDLRQWVEEKRQGGVLFSTGVR